MKKMNRAFSSYACMIALALLFAACTKTGKTGATGATGPAGPAGAAGAAGTAGPAGSQIYEGSGTPLSSLGNVGDFYINEKTDSLYGPKTLSGWGTAISLQGAAGAAGTNGTNGSNGSNGSQIISGSDTPKLSQGNAGDYYFDTFSDALYGPKTSTGWGNPTSLRGAQGPEGPSGSANVIYFPWEAFSSGTWTAVNGFGNRSYNIDMPEINSTILDNSVILVYLEYFVLSGSDTATEEVYLMPANFNNFTYVLNRVTCTDVAGITQENQGYIEFNLADALDAGDPGTLITGSSLGYMYRIIIIPGGLEGPSLDAHTQTYAQVCSKYGINP